MAHIPDLLIADRSRGIRSHQSSNQKKGRRGGTPMRGSRRVGLLLIAPTGISRVVLY